MDDIWDLDKLFNEYIEPSVKMNKHIEIMNKDIRVKLSYSPNVIKSYYVYYQGNYYIFSMHEMFNDEFLVTNDFINYYKVSKSDLRYLKSFELMKVIKIYNYHRLLNLFPEIQSKYISPNIDNDMSLYTSQIVFKALIKECDICIIDGNVFIRVIGHLFYLPPMTKLLPFYPP